jgi:hypothetical protein
MDNKKITGEDIIKMIPCIDKKLDNAMSLYGKKYYPPLNENNKLEKINLFELVPSLENKIKDLLRSYEIDNHKQQFSEYTEKRNTK